jgi:hypothetical protein
MQFEAYLERSKSVPLEVQLPDLLSLLFKSLVPHTSRLAFLAVWVEGSSDLSWIARYLPSPIPTLRRFAIVGDPALDPLELPSGIGNGYLLHVKELQLEGISSLQASHAFPHVTQLVWFAHSRPGVPIQLAGLVDALEQLPVLERVEVSFRTSQYITTNPAPRVVTLPHVQRMLLWCYKDEKAGIPHILEFLKLPSLTSLTVEMMPGLRWPFPTLPVTSFGERLPNFAELPQMEVNTGDRVTLRSTSQAVLECLTNGRCLGEAPYRHDRKLWGGLPLHSVRRLTATLYRWKKDVEDVWLFSLLRDLGSLGHLELEEFCGYALRRLRRMVMRGDILLGIKTLTVRSGTYEIRQALRLKEVVDGLGLGIILICIPDPKIPDTGGWYPDADGLSEGWSDEGESDHDSAGTREDVDEMDSDSGSGQDIDED